MKRSLKKTVLLFVLLLMAFTLFASNAGAAYSEDVIVIYNKTRLPRNYAAQIEAAGGTVSRALSQVGAVSVIANSPDFTANMMSESGVRSVVPNIELSLIDPTDVRAYTGNPPNSGDDDFLFDLQWGHDAIDAVESRDAGATGAGVRVAILDSGIDSTHPDLAPNLNTSLSASFVPGEGFDILPGVYFNHGSHVAGIVAAADNGVGVVGVAPEAELVAIKVLSEFTGSGSFDGVAAGILYAADIGSDIMNMSLGSGPIPRIPGAGIEEIWFLMGRVTSYAHRKGTTIVAAAGNDAFDYDNDDPDAIDLPSMSPFVISVSATAPVGWATDPANSFLDNLASYSNFGERNVHVSAPGGDFIYPGNENCTIAGVTVPCWVFDLVISASSESWFWAAGTSMASPHAAGVAALIIAANGGSMNPDAVENALYASSDDLGDPGFDAIYGYGRVNAYNAVSP